MAVPSDPRDRLPPPDWAADFEKPPPALPPFIPIPDDFEQPPPLPPVVPLPPHEFRDLLPPFMRRFCPSQQQCRQWSAECRSFIHHWLTRVCKGCGRAWSALDSTARLFLVCAVGLVLPAVLLPHTTLWGLATAGLLVFGWRARRWRDLDRKGRSFVVCGNLASVVALVLAISGLSGKPGDEARNLGASSAASDVARSPAKEKAPTVLPAIRDFILDEYHPLAGDVGCIMDPVRQAVLGECVRIEKIIDDRSCIVGIYVQASNGPASGFYSGEGLVHAMQTQAGGSGFTRRQQMLLLNGWPTAGKVTGQQEDVSQTLFRVTGTSNHKTIDGGSVTMYDMEVVKPLVVGDVVRLPFASGKVWRTVDKNSCFVQPHGQKENDYFVSILVKGWSIPENKEVRLDQTLFRVAGTLRIEPSGGDFPNNWVYDLEALEPAVARPGN